MACRQTGTNQTIIWINAGILLTRILATNFSEILSEIVTFSLKKMHFKMSSAKWRQFCLGLNVLHDLHDSNTDCNAKKKKQGTQHKSLQYMGPVMKVRLSCYVVLLSIDSKTR